MIDVGGVALLGAAARNYAGVAAIANPAHYGRVVARAARARARLGRAPPAARRRGLRHRRRLPRRDRGLLDQVCGDPFPSRLAMVLEKVDDLRYGENPHQRAAFYRETTHRTGTLADADQLQGSPAHLQRPARPRRGLPDSPRTSPRPTVVDRQAHRSGRAGLRTTSSSRPTGRPSRRIPVACLRWHRRASTASSTARRPARSPPTRTRRSIAPRLLPSRRSASCARRPASSCWPCRPTRPRACATTASPTSTSSASAAACWSRARTSSSSTSASSRS